MTIVLPLSAGNTIMSVSLLRSWRTNRSCLMMWRGFGFGKETGYLSADSVCLF